MNEPPKPSLGTDPETGYSIPIDTDKLVESRLLITATSGQGKSWALRRILEQTHGHVQHIVIDPEGEFFTLREIFDYVLARAGHEAERDCPADVRSAELLARRLLELGVSAVVDIYDLKPDHRTLFVKLFLESVMEAPRALWHPVLIVIDETHLFAPQSGDSQSGAAVADLMGRGRKRGFAGCVASQRFSKVHKDVAAMCQNVLIGGFTLDVDVKRASDSLGFVGKDADARIRDLRPGNFFVQGPAFSREVHQVKIGGVQTTHPKAGQRAPLPAVPRAKIKSVLDQLTNLPAEVDRKLRTEADLRAEVKRLESEISKRDREAAKSTADPQAVENARRDGYSQGYGTANGVWTELAGHMNKIADEIDAMNAIAARASKSKSPTSPPSANDPNNTDPKVYIANRDKKFFEGLAAGLAVKTGFENTKGIYEENGHLKLPAGARRLLSAALTWYGKGLSEGTWRAAATLKKSGSYDTYKSKLLTNGLIEILDGLVYATEAGLKYAGNDLPATPMNTKEVLACWEPKLTAGARRMLDVLIRQNRPLSREEIGEASAVSPDGGSFDTYLSQLRTAQLITKAGKTFEVNREVLFL
jgi:uncharacterized protein